MSISLPPLDARTSLADLAATRPGAARVFHRHGLDFCCHGRVSVADACARRGLVAADVLRAIEAEAPLARDFRRWDERPLADLITHLLEEFHARHREELPRLVEWARKVEAVHADKAQCPRGLADHLEQMSAELDSHMEKEEQVLFPMLLDGRGRMASMPIGVMEEEHADHGRNLERLRELTHAHVVPDGACNTWRALYAGIAELDERLMQHIHLENNVLFPRALRG